LDKKRKRRILILAAALIAVVSLLSGWYFMLRKGVSVGDDFFYKVSENRYAKNKSDYIERISEGEFKIGSDAGEKIITLSQKADMLVMDFMDGTVAEGYWDGKYFRNKEGVPFGWDNIQITTDNEPVRVNDKSYCHALCKIYFGAEETMAPWYTLVAGLIIYILGLISIMYPEEVHFLFKQWQYNKPELSDAGRLAEQIGGAVVVVVGICIMSGIMRMFVK